MKKICLIVILAFCSNNLVRSQVKFAHVNVQEIITSMPEYSKAQAEVDSLQSINEADLKLMQNEVQKKEVELQNLSEDTPENIKRRRQQEIQDLHQKIEQCYMDNQQALQKVALEKMQMISAKVREAIKAIGQEDGYLYIFDFNGGGIPYISTTLSTDVTAKVKTKLGLK